MCCTKSLRFYVESNKFEDLLVPPTLSLDQLLLSNTLSTPTVILRADLMYDYYDSGILDEIKEQMPIVMGIIHYGYGLHGNRRFIIYPHQL